MAREKRVAGEKATCPCCGKARSTEPLARQEALLDRHGRTPWGCTAGWAIGTARSGRLQWACDGCLRAGRALVANAWKQTFCDHPPRLAYFDQTLRCAACGERFVFAAAEQRFWFETLGFWVQSTPRQCSSCRRARRQRVLAQTEAGRVMASLDTTSPDSLAAAATALLAVGSRRKAAECLRRAKNLVADGPKRAELIRRLEALTEP